MARRRKPALHTPLMVVVAWVEDDAYGRPITGTEAYPAVGIAPATGDDGRPCHVPLFVLADRILTVDQARESGAWGNDPQVALVPMRPHRQYWLEECQRRQDELAEAAEGAYARRCEAEGRTVPAADNLN